MLIYFVAIHKNNARNIKRIAECAIVEIPEVTDGVLTSDNYSAAYAAAIAANPVLGNPDLHVHANVLESAHFVKIASVDV